MDLKEIEGGKTVFRDTNRAGESERPRKGGEFFD